MIYVRREQAEVLLRLKDDLATAEGIARDAEGRLNLALGAVMAGIAPEGSGVEAVYIDGDKGVIVTEEPA